MLKVMVEVNVDQEKVVGDGGGGDVGKGGRRR